jgi:hypothetical protein
MKEPIEHNSNDAAEQSILSLDEVVNNSLISQEPAIGKILKVIKPQSDINTDR